MKQRNEKAYINRGINCELSKPLILNDVTYDSINDACRALGRGDTWVRNQIKKGNGRFVEKEEYKRLSKGQKKKPSLGLIKLI